MTSMGADDLRPTRPWRLLAACLLAMSLGAGCNRAQRPPALTDADHLVGPSESVYAVTGYDDRDFILRLPPGYDGSKPLPIVFGFHGGGGKKGGFVRTGCLDGDVESTNCLSALADREAFALVVPDGLDARGLRGRSWNAGGGAGGYRCVGGAACETQSDDVAYFDALLAEVRRAVAVDDRRIFAMGMSNGGAMSHRLACERADVLAAVASVGGANQAQGAPGCSPTRPVAVLHIHGTEDTCWGYDGKITESLCDDGTDGRFMDVATSMDGWRKRNGCTDTKTEALEDRVSDGTRSTRIVGVGCAAATDHVRIEGGGHTWPSGWQYLPERRIGRVARDFDANALIWQFFKANAR